MVHEKIVDFDSCVRCCGNYFNLHSIMCFLRDNYQVTFDEKKFDETYDHLNEWYALDIVEMFDIVLDDDELEKMREFLRNVDYLEPDFKKNVVKYILNNVLPNRKSDI